MNLDRSIIAFSLTMQSKLDRNQHKECARMNPDGKGRGWNNCDVAWLLMRLREETGELEEALRAGTPQDIREEAADVGNFAMMIHDNLSESSPTKPPEPSGD